VDGGGLRCLAGVVAGSLDAAPAGPAEEGDPFSLAAGHRLRDNHFT